MDEKTNSVLLERKIWQCRARFFPFFFSRERFGWTKLTVNFFLSCFFFFPLGVLFFDRTMPSKEFFTDQVFAFHLVRFFFCECLFCWDFSRWRMVWGWGKLFAELLFTSDFNDPAEWIVIVSEDIMNDVGVNGEGKGFPRIEIKKERKCLFLSVSTWKDFVMASIVGDKKHENWGFLVFFLRVFLVRLIFFGFRVFENRMANDELGHWFPSDFEML